MSNTFPCILCSQNYPDTKAKQKISQEKNLQMNISYEYGCKNPQNILANQGQQYIKRIIHHDPLEFISGMKSHCSTCKAINEIQHVKESKPKT